MSLIPNVHIHSCGNLKLDILHRETTQTHNTDTYTRAIQPLLYLWGIRSPKPLVASPDLPGLWSIDAFRRPPHNHFPTTPSQPHLHSDGSLPLRPLPASRTARDVRLLQLEGRLPVSELPSSCGKVGSSAHVRGVYESTCVAGGE